MTRARATDSGLLIPADFAWDVARLAFNPRGTLLAAGDLEADHVLVFDVRSGRAVARLTDLPKVEWLGFLSGDVLLTLSGDGLTRFDLRRGGREPLWAGAPPVRSAAVAPGGKVVALGVWQRYSSTGVVLYDAARRQPLRRAEIDLELYPERLTFSERGRYVVADCSIYEYSGPRILVIWDARTGRRFRTFVVNEQCEVVTAFLGDTLTLAVHAYQDVLLFDPERGEDPAAAYPVEGGRNALAFRDGGRTLAVFTYGGAVTLLRASTGRVVRRIPPPAGPELWNGTVSRDWSRFAAVTEGGVFVWPAGPALTARKGMGRKRRQ